MDTSSVGTWLSLVEHRVRDAGVAGSNPVVPTRLLYLSRLDKPRKTLKRAVVGGLSLWRKAAGREFPHPEMIRNALAANPFPGARDIGTITCFKILLFIAFHDTYLLGVPHRNRPSQT